MFGKKFNLVAALLLAFLLTACESGPPKVVNEPGVTRLNGDQARAHISGNTEKWQNGTGYYNPNGEMEVVWRKNYSKGTWQGSADGMVCLEIRDWKPGCHYYVNNNGAITLITDGSDTPLLGSRNRGVNEIIKGKKLPQR